MQTIDFQVYKEKTSKQLVVALDNAEKKREKFLNQIKEQDNLISFLTAELRGRLNEPKYNFIPYKQSKSHKLAKDYQATLSKGQIELLQKEVEREINKNYNEL